MLHELLYDSGNHLCSNASRAVILFSGLKFAIFAMRSPKIFVDDFILPQREWFPRVLGVETRPHCLENLDPGVFWVPIMEILEEPIERF